MPTDEEMLRALREAVRDGRLRGGFAEAAMQRRRSFDRRTEARHPSRQLRVRDLVKGLR